MPRTARGTTYDDSTPTRWLWQDEVVRPPRTHVAWTGGQLITVLIPQPASGRVRIGYILETITYDFDAEIPVRKWNVCNDVGTPMSDDHNAYMDAINELTDGAPEA